MKIKLSTTLLGALAAPLFLAQSLQAQFVEAGDAPENIAGAQQTGTTNAPLTSISGSFSSVTDADLFRIFISNPATFSATTVNSATGLSIDSQLFLFTLQGLPIYTNDNEPSGASNRSTLPAGNSLRPTTAGYYVLGISLSGYDPVDSIGRLLFADATTGQEVRGPNPNVNPRQPLAGWTAQDFGATAGAYRIDVTGASAIPEPSTWALLVTGAAMGGIAAYRRRKQNSTAAVS